MPNEKSVARRAVRWVMNYERKHGKKVKDVQCDRHFLGCDIIRYSDKKRAWEKVEVKGSTKPHGIPDCFQTEFTKNGKLVADFMYVVNFEKKKAKLYIIPKKAFKPEHTKIRIGYRISNTFKTKILPTYKIKY
jgi:hypothetical protein